MAPFPAPEKGILLTHFVVSEDIARSRDFYANVLGGEVVSESPAVVAPYASESIQRSRRRAWRAISSGSRNVLVSRAIPW